MVRILEEFPGVRQTFNLVPSMMAQVAEYAAGRGRGSVSATGPQAGREPERRKSAPSCCSHSFYSDPQRMIYRYPRYGELYRRLAGAEEIGARASAVRGAGISRPADVVAARLVRRGVPGERPGGRANGCGAAAISRSTTSAAWARSSARSSARCCRYTTNWRPRGQIEISTTPVLPPHSAAAVRFQYRRAWRTRTCRCRRASVIPRTPAGSWRWRANTCPRTSAWRRWGCGLRKARFPTRCSRSQPRSASNGPPPTAACSTGRWAAPVPSKGSTARTAGGRSDAQLGVIFRDHFLSDLIGFVYSKMDAAAAADDFLRRIRENCAGILASGRDALVPIILDGENAWEYYDRNGRPFLRELYRRIIGRSRHERRHGERSAAPDGRRSRWTISFRAPGSTPISTSGSARRKTTRPGRNCCARARPTTRQLPASPKSGAPHGLRGTADRRRQRLVLVVRPGARFRQPRGVRPALSQPPGQRLPFPESGAARGAVAAHSAGRDYRMTLIEAQRSHHAGDRRRSDFIFRMDGRRHVPRGRAARAPCTARNF